jgi:hypothetical protein
MSCSRDRSAASAITGRDCSQRDRPSRLQERTHPLLLPLLLVRRDELNRAREQDVQHHRRNEHTSSTRFGDLTSLLIVQPTVPSSMRTAL